MKEIKTLKDIDFTSLKLPAVAIYDSPSDYPGKIVARLWDKGEPTETILIKDNIDDMREDINQAGLTCHIPRGKSDDPCIVECWI